MARPANGRFRKGWLNRMADFRFFAVIMFGILCFCPGGCKSVSPQEKSGTSAETSGSTLKETHSAADRQLNRIAVNRSAQSMEEETVSETLVIHYDTSLPKDAETGSYPVKSVSLTTAAGSLKAGASSGRTEHTGIRQAETSAGRTQTAVRRKTGSMSEKHPGKDPYRWRYLSAAITAAAVIAGCILKFISRRKE
jgi:hypothetical protein